MRKETIIWFVFYIGMIVAANTAITLFGIIPIGFGLMAPAGTLFAGASFIVRDYLQESTNKKILIVAIVIGALVSMFIADISIALASGIAFFTSELLDYSVYTPLRDKNRLAAIVLSNTAGLLLDTMLFLYIASLPLSLAPGQIVAKLSITGVFVLLYALIRKKR